MSVSVSDVMRHVRNHFVIGFADGNWQLQDGRLLPEIGLSPGAWIALTDADHLTGVHQLDEHGQLPHLPDNLWSGRLWMLAPPADFLRLCREISQWDDAHPDPTLVSERFGEYSRSQSGTAWQRVFASSLSPYFRMYPEVNV